MPTKRQELVVEITAQADDAKRSIDQLTKAAKPLEEGVDVPVKLTGADKAAGQLEDAAQAGKRLGTAVEGIHVRDIGGPAKIAADTFEKVAEEAERAGRAVDDVGRGAGGGLTEVGNAAGRTKEQLATTEQASEGARNAFANLVGNTAQDLGQVGGVVGSLGVAIGQVAEYTADATAKGGGLAAALGGAAQMAGPLAALALAGAAVSKVVGDMQKKSAEAKAANEALRDSFVAGTGVLEEWTSGLEDSVDATDVFNRFIADTLDKTGDLEKTATAMGELNLSLDDMGEAVAGADKDFKGWATSMLMAQGFSQAAARDIAEVVSQNEKLGDALDVVNTNAEHNALSKMITPEQKASLDGIVRGLAQVNDLAEKSNIEKQAKDTNDLSRASKDYIDIVDRGRESGRSELQIMQDVTTAQQRQKEAREENARAAEEGARAVAEAGSIIEQVGRQEEEAAQRAADAMDKAKTAQDNWLLHEVDYQAGVDAFTTSLYNLTEQTKKQAEAGDEGAGSFEGNTKAALDNRDALGDVYSKAVAVVQSMKDAGFSVDGARDAQDNMAQSAYDLAIQMGYPIQKAEEIRDKIKQIPPSVTSEVAITEQGYSDVKAKKDTLEQDMESTLFIYGVLDRSVLNAINSLPPGSIPSSRGVTPASSAVVPATSTLAAPAAAAPAGVAVMPAAAPASRATVAVPVTVNVSAGVVADTFQLQRVVERAVRSGARLGGRR